MSGRFIWKWKKGGLRANTEQEKKTILVCDLGKIENIPFYYTLYDDWKIALFSNMPSNLKRFLLAAGW